MGRDPYLDRVPGFVEFHLLKGPEGEDHTLYASHTVWQSKAAFEGWTKSEEFRAAHARAGNDAKGPLYLDQIRGLRGTTDDNPQGGGRITRSGRFFSSFDPAQQMRRCNTSSSYGSTCPAIFDLTKRMVFVTGASRGLGLDHGRGTARRGRDRQTHWPRRKHAKDRR